MQVLNENNLILIQFDFIVITTYKHKVTKCHLASNSNASAVKYNTIIYLQSDLLMKFLLSGQSVMCRYFSCFYDP